MSIRREMAWGAAWCSVLPLWLLWGAAYTSAAASGDDNAVPFDIEGSSLVGRQDPSLTSDPRVILGRLLPAVEVQCSLLLPPYSSPVPAIGVTVLFLSPALFDNLDFHLDQGSSVEIKGFAL